MGFYSWKTADSNKTIWNRFTEFCKPVYLLQPNGKQPISEPSYEGYGRFGGKSALVWLAEQNLPSFVVEKMDEEQLHHMGIKLTYGFDSFIYNTVGYVLKDEEETLLTYGLLAESTRYNVVDSFNEELTIDNQVIKVMDLRNSPGAEELKVTDLDRPLKFSFSKDAVYEYCSPSDNCPNQGFFSGD